jgi:hypothetical protein
VILFACTPSYGFYSTTRFLQTTEMLNHREGNRRAGPTAVL